MSHWKEVPWQAQAPPQGLCLLADLEATWDPPGEQIGQGEENIAFLLRLLPLTTISGHAVENGRMAVRR